MKKIILGIILTLSYFSVATAGPGINIGISGQMGLFSATGSEKDIGTNGTTTDADENRSRTDILGIAYSSFFIEKTLGSRLTIGYDYVPDALATESQEHITTDQRGSTTDNAVTNKVQVDFEDLSTYYLAVNLNENVYIKAGIVEVDLITNEKLDTGSTYGNTSIDGNMMGVGYNKTFDNGIFLRGEGTYIELDGTSLTSSTGVNVITLNNIDGVTGKLSIGKSF